MANSQTQKIETAVLGGGCFWCQEALFLHIKGVTSVVSGYAGGSLENPTYEQVISGKTNHAEVVKIDYNPGIISFAELLYIFFYVHDPTTKDRQGSDVGTQYRSVIFLPTRSRKKLLKKSSKSLKIKKPLAVRLSQKLFLCPNFILPKNISKDILKRILKKDIARLS